MKLALCVPATIAPPALAVPVKGGRPPSLPRLASAAAKPCSMYQDHGSARPAFTQGHHLYPVYLQNKVWGRIVLPNLVWLCGTCHDNLHGWLYWIQGERFATPIGVPARARAAAEAVDRWYEGATAARVA